MKALFFANSGEFSDWLEENHLIQKEVYVGFYKISSGKPSLTWSQSVDVALCFGWIDGVKKSIDGESYMQRFTPRKEASNWSLINLKKIELLIQKGLMRPAGIEIYNKRRLDKCAVYSFENEPAKLSDEMESIFRKNIEAWMYFKNQSPTYRKSILHWIMSAKQESTRFSRLEKLIISCSNKQRLL